MDINELFDRINSALLAENSRLYTGYSPKKGAKPCSVQGCKNTISSNGLCNAHYIRKRLGKNMLAPIRHNWTKEGDKKCSDCGLPTGNKGGWGLCKAHYSKRRRDIIRTVCIQAMGGKCVQCGGVFPSYVYDFHHRNPNEKEDAIGNYINKWSIKRMAQEVIKCDLLCANCHRIEHYERKFSASP